MIKFLHVTNLLALIALIILVLMFVFRNTGSSDSASTRELIKDVSSRLDQASHLLQKQQLAMDSLRLLNDSLWTRTQRIDSLNREIKRKVDLNLVEVRSQVSKIREAVAGPPLEDFR